MKTLKFLVLLSLLSSCGKEKSELCNVLPNSIYECVELGEEPYLDWNYYLDTNHYLYPRFNPNNGNEIIYTIKNYASGTSKLYKYNLITHARLLLFEGDQIFSPSWGSNDWILLNLSDRSIWKIKSDGTGLVNVLNTGNDFEPVWNKDSTIFSVFRGSFADNLQKTILYTEDGIPYDTLQNTGIGSTMDWRIDGLACGVGIYGPGVYDINNDIQIFFDSGQYNFTGGAFWLNNNEFIWSYEKGIYKSNYVTGEKKLIKSSCQTRMYQSPTYHSNINKVIWKRVDLKQLNEFDVEVKSRLFIMNADGTEEKELILD